MGLTTTAPQDAARDRQPPTRQIDATIQPSIDGPAGDATADVIKKSIDTAISRVYPLDDFAEYMETQLW